MTVKDLIITLLEYDLNKTVSVQYPSKSKLGNNYYTYDSSEDIIIISNSDKEVIIGVQNV